MSGSLCDRCGGPVEESTASHLAIIDPASELARTICSTCRASFRQWWYGQNL